MATYRGVDASQEIKDNINIRDTKTMPQRINDFFGKKEFPFIFVGVVGLLMFLLPIFAELFFLCALAFYPKFKKGQEHFVLPFKLPQTAEMLDWHNPKPGQPGTASKAAGTVFIGNALDTNMELWLTDSDVRQHILIFGTTGAGKAYSLNEEFLTPNGWVKNRDLKPNDLIMTPFGFSKVVELFPQKKQKMMEVIFENGITKRVSADHLWEFYGEILPAPTHDFEAFRSKQRIQVSETRHIQTLLKQGKKISIPHAPMLGSSAMEIHSSMADLGAFLADYVKNGSLPRQSDELSLIHRLLDDSSLGQRQALVDVFIERLLLKPETYNNILYKHNQVQGIFTSNLELLDILHKLFGSVGYVANKQKDILGKWSLKLKNQFYLEIVDIVDLDSEEDCQCIKIEDPRGLLTLKDNITGHNTEAILSLLTNPLIQGSGFIFVDGKADLSTFAKLFSLCRSFRREEDLLVINYMTSGQDVFGPQARQMSNTLNPFISGSSSGLTETVVGLMSSGGNSDPMWEGRAIALVSALMMSLTWQRDNEGLLLNVEVLRDSLLLNKVAELAVKKYGTVEGISNALNAYLTSIPGYNAAKGGDEQSDTTNEQHGYLSMQFTRILGSLSDTYGYIFKTPLGHVDFKDVVLNRRILLVMLPALEKSAPELQNLGKVIVSCIKSMMAATLGSNLDSNIKDSIENRATNALSAFYCVFDEYGYYIVKGSAVMPAQARSLGFCMIFAAQDLPSLQKNDNKEEATSIIANCNLKIFMRVEDPNETFELANKTAGQVQVEAVKSKERQINKVLGGYEENLQVSYETRSRINWHDLKEQFDGMAHLFHGSVLARGKFFFTNPDIPDNLKFRANSFIQVEPPKLEEIEEDKDVINKLYHTFTDGTLDELKEDVYIGQERHLEKLNLFTQACNKATIMNEFFGCSAFLYLSQFVISHEQALNDINAQYKEEMGGVNLADETFNFLRKGGEGLFKDKEELGRKLEAADALLYNTKAFENTESQISNKTIKEMEVATNYSPNIENLENMEEEMFSSIVRDLGQQLRNENADS